MTVHVDGGDARRESPARANRHAGCTLWHTSDEVGGDEGAAGARGSGKSGGIVGTSIGSAVEHEPPVHALMRDGVVESVAKGKE
jgi:hypothetical protein